MARVAILLATHNGARYLASQLASIAAQTHQDWVIVASDDGSRDETLDLLGQVEAKWTVRFGGARLLVRHGPCRGFVANFLTLACNPGVVADLYAWCDQDDEWHPAKLARAVAALAAVDGNRPALYGSRTELIDEDGRSLGLSPEFRRPPGFRNALLQNVMGGNTMVFNESARQLLAAAGPVPVVAHDWWSYLAVSAAGGTIRYDPWPSLRYRQHGNNIFGSNHEFGARWHRLTRLFMGEWSDWNARNQVALDRIFDRLTPENQMILTRFRAARLLSPAARLGAMAACRVYRRTRLESLGFLLAVAAGRI